MKRRAATLDARTALEWGLVNRVVPAAQLDSAVYTLAQTIARKSAPVVALGKRAFYAQIELDERRAYELTKDVMASNAELDDAQEGIGAFVGKRQPVWSNQ